MMMSMTAGGICALSAAPKGYPDTWYLSVDGRGVAHCITDYERRVLLLAMFSGNMTISNWAIKIGR